MPSHLKGLHMVDLFLFPSLSDMACGHSCRSTTPVELSFRLYCEELDDYRCLGYKLVCRGNSSACCV